MKKQTNQARANRSQKSPRKQTKNINGFWLCVPDALRLAVGMQAEKEGIKDDDWMLDAIQIKLTTMEESEDAPAPGDCMLPVPFPQDCLSDLDRVAREHGVSREKFIAQAVSEKVNRAVFPAKLSLDEEINRDGEAVLRMAKGGWLKFHGKASLVVVNSKGGCELKEIPETLAGFSKVDILTRPDNDKKDGGKPALFDLEDDIYEASAMIHLLAAKLSDYVCLEKGKDGQVAGQGMLHLARKMIERLNATYDAAFDECVPASAARKAVKGGVR